MKYYKAEDVERLIENICNVMIGKEEPIETALCDLPTIEVSEGEWLKRDVCEYRCANCGKIQFADCDHELNYCCNCGSRNKWKGKYIDRDSDEGVRNE